MKNASNFSKDNSATTILLAAWFALIIAATFSSTNAAAKAPALLAPKATVITATDSRNTVVKVDAIVVTATRLK